MTTQTLSRHNNLNTAGTNQHCHSLLERTIADGAHAVLAYAVRNIAAGALLLAEVALAVHVRLVGGGEVSAAPKESGHCLRDLVQDLQHSLVRAESKGICNMLGIACIDAGGTGQLWRTCVAWAPQWAPCNKDMLILLRASCACWYVA